MTGELLPLLPRVKDLQEFAKPKVKRFKLEVDLIDDPDFRVAIARRKFHPQESHIREKPTAPAAVQKVDLNKLRNRQKELVAEINALKSEKRKIFSLIATQSTRKASSEFAENQSKHTTPAGSPVPEEKTVFSNEEDEKPFSTTNSSENQAPKAPKGPVAQRTSLLALFENPETLAQLQSQATDSMISSPKDILGAVLSPPKLVSVVPEPVNTEAVPSTLASSIASLNSVNSNDMYNNTEAEDVLSSSTAHSVRGSRANSSDEMDEGEIVDDDSSPLPKFKKSDGNANLTGISSHPLPHYYHPQPFQRPAPSFPTRVHQPHRSHVRRKASRSPPSRNTLPEDGRNSSKEISGNLSPYSPHPSPVSAAPMAGGRTKSDRFSSFSGYSSQRSGPYSRDYSHHHIEAHRNRSQQGYGGYRGGNNLSVHTSSSNDMLSSSVSAAPSSSSRSFARSNWSGANGESARYSKHTDHDPRSYYSEGPKSASASYNTSYSGRYSGGVREREGKDRDGRDSRERDRDRERDRERFNSGSRPYKYDGHSQRYN